jgi:hypothetical protein
MKAFFLILIVSLSGARFVSAQSRSNESIRGLNGDDTLKLNRLIDSLRYVASSHKFNSNMPVVGFKNFHSNMPVARIKDFKSNMPVVQFKNRDIPK